MLKTKKTEKTEKTATCHLRGNARRVAEVAEEMRKWMSMPLGPFWHYCHWHEGCDQKVHSCTLLCKKHWEECPASKRAEVLNGYVRTLRANGMDAEDLGRRKSFPESRKNVAIDMSAIADYIRPIANCPTCIRVLSKQ